MVKIGKSINNIRTMKLKPILCGSDTLSAVAEEVIKSIVI